ncbi:MAG: phosphoenolpyruvate carboxykinase [Acidobacteria bacterium]|nr:phosphoenolpyruvate carboxykinase [Acidobacteriota bacterium]
MATLDIPVKAQAVIDNPDLKELRRLTGQMRNARETRYGNLNVTTKVLSRSSQSTYVVTGHSEYHSDQTISLEEGARIARRQEEHLKNRDVIVVDGFIGNDPGFRVRARLIMEKAYANIAAMQHILYYDSGRPHTSAPTVTVIYTPGLDAPGYPDDRIIAVDLENNITRVLNSDYFGESKKGGLRMWNKVVYDRGGLAMHAGCKIIPAKGRNRAGLIVGLSGTGKTTTTFTRQNNSQPVQDDFVALMPGGKVYATEDGCFAKTYGLDPRYEPTIHRAVTSPTAFLENVSQKEVGELDFFDTSYTQNGRAVFPMSSVEGAGNALNMERADFLLILNRNDNIIPAVARLRGAQAAAFFMLGETKGTSAGGAAEAGKFLRIPGTNPFFPQLHSQQGNRFLELLSTYPLEVYLMNTGRVGGDEGQPGSKKVKIPHSSAIVKAIAEETIQWTRDPDFGYEIAAHVPGFPDEDPDLLQPVRLYQAHGRTEEYSAMVQKIRGDRASYLRKWPGLAREIVEALE